ncbi:DNA-3-methyladenine glycosylase I [Candidatus Woesearchaeota archaeon]|nr:DNA-3-methyladenine glycosylase I [Candidatus Woesearchaeota archaeon]
MTHIHSKPKTNAEFLEAMAEIIFISGFRWDLVHSRWPKIRMAFHNFDIKKVANERLENLLNKDGIIKNKSKINAIIENAKMCSNIINKHKSINKWIKNIQKNNKKQPLFNPTVREEMKKFSKIGNTTSRWLAYVVTRDRKLLDNNQT